MSAGLLRAGILAAGRGERLRTQPTDLKPLARVGGETLIERVLNSIAETGAAEVTVIINDDSLFVRENVEKMSWPFRLSWIVETTPTSMHSFL
ncbi:MAG TPA: NTP transferase domain-containing protein, partial [Chthoniobacterales bacterium]